MGKGVRRAKPLQSMPVQNPAERPSQDAVNPAVAADTPALSLFRHDIDLPHRDAAAPAPTPRQDLRFSVEPVRDTLSREVALDRSKVVSTSSGSFPGPRARGQGVMTPR